MLGRQALNAFEKSSLMLMTDLIFYYFLPMTFFKKVSKTSFYHGWTIQKWENFEKLGGYIEPEFFSLYARNFVWFKTTETHLFQQPFPCADEAENQYHVFR